MIDNMAISLDVFNACHYQCVVLFVEAYNFHHALQVVLLLKMI